MAETKKSSSLPALSQASTGSSVDEKFSLNTTAVTSTYDDYEPPALISQSVVLGLGVFCFLLAMVWPPLILAVAFVASKIVPYSYRINDDASTRRLLLHKFYTEDPIAIQRQQLVLAEVNLETSYWMNPRGLLLHTHIMTPKDQDVKAVVW
jgi:hypothetical protein